MSGGLNKLNNNLQHRSDVAAGIGHRDPGRFKGLSSEESIALDERLTKEEALFQKTRTEVGKKVWEEGKTEKTLNDFIYTGGKTIPINSRDKITKEGPGKPLKGMGNSQHNTFHIHEHGVSPADVENALASAGLLR